MTKASANKARPPLKVPKQLWDQANSKGVRNWCFTWNNYDEASEELLQAMKTTWLIYEKENAPSTGTPHLQGATVFKDQKTFSALNRLTKKKCIWAPMICPEWCSETYCNKLNIAFESGRRPMSPKEIGKKEVARWDDIKAAAKRGDLEAVPSKEFICHYNVLKRIATDYAVDPMSLNHLNNEWIYGETGTGKSFPYEQMRDLHQTCFFKTHDKLWQGYRGEPVVCIDEFDPEDAFMLRMLKSWMGKGVIEAKVHFAHGKFRPKRVIVCSNYHPNEIWDEKKLGPLYRRMKIYKQVGYDEKIFEDTGFDTPPTDPYDPSYVFGEDA